jgi:septum formation protein
MPSAPVEPAGLPAAALWLTVSSMSGHHLPVVLGSRSPRRRELLSLLIGEDRVLVRPPRNPSEPDLTSLHDLEALREQLSALARSKGEDVAAQMPEGQSLSASCGILTADTVIVGFEEDGRCAVLGQPPESGDWQSVVRDWFRRYYFGRTHLALTAICLRAEGSFFEDIVTTQVRFREDGENWLDWYLSTGEPLGKAGGYGLQGAASLFVASIGGSPSNVIGLPLRETAELLSRTGLLSLAHNP